MDQGRRPNLVIEADSKTADLRDEAGLSVRLQQPKNLGRFTVHLDRPAHGAQDGNTGFAGARMRDSCKRSCADDGHGHRRAQEPAARNSHDALASKHPRARWRRFGLRWAQLTLMQINQAFSGRLIVQCFTS
jgi:hypothetical protein